jgi:bifunctional non-homologous end joining protein LigD
LKKRRGPSGTPS